MAPPPPPPPPPPSAPPPPPPGQPSAPGPSPSTAKPSPSDLLAELANVTLKSAEKNTSPSTGGEHRIDEQIISSQLKRLKKAADRPIAKPASHSTTPHDELMNLIKVGVKLRHTKKDKAEEPEKIQSPSDSHVDLLASALKTIEHFSSPSSDEDDDGSDVGSFQDSD
ncbi:neural Wiskott-Aldrich syndrome protein-like [Lingula anatina]|uniref:Neural Wiskott-Aldrich syndrome protein-like n=1 Tax=Lingula anatina TaxID=7574 RepID=A0A1S3IR84_LINAN|nr:neural Wiskott-Aldrich syndrome protein-like [Lingula anatina]|eukprot:XP_013400446.1 neural Wiskott-Aldrich syndrome protein-like [Lingula anatina]